MGRSRIYILMLALFFCWTGCNVYSFTGASISPDIKTVSIQYIRNNASIVQPTLSQALTEKLKDKFTSQTNLTLVTSNGDIQFEGAITNYNTQPIAIQGNETAAYNRLSIGMTIKYTNVKEPKQNFESNFSRYADFDSKQSLSTVESELIRQINEQLVDDIFNRAMINW